MANANLPKPQSYEQILSTMLSAYAAKIGINDFNVGSVNTSFFEVVALSTARASGDLFQVLRDFSIDRATGDALKRLALEYNIKPITSKVSTGLVTITDTSFSKKSTKIYSGSTAPNIGSTQIKVSDASLFTSTGSIYIGRGTPNIEGPLTIDPLNPPTQVGSYWVINLLTPTTKFHNLGESVILAQGGTRSIPVGSLVLSPGIGATDDILFSTTIPAFILDGETEVADIEVSALLPGIDGNVTANSIKKFSVDPFPGASVTNPLPFTTGSDNETDDELRIRVKRSLASQGLGTATAIESYLIGATASDENATIVSNSLTVNTDGSATVYIDDGTGYEAKTEGVGLEFIVDSALGGEQFFQLQTGGNQAPVAKAFLETTFLAPFDLVGGDTLAVVVGETTYQHTFSSTDFVSPGSVTAFEVTASINGNSTLGFEATTSGAGSYVVIRAKAEENDSLYVTIPTTTSGRDAAVQMSFPSNVAETLKLYKNNIPLSKDGKTASLFTQAQQLWSSTIANGDTIILSVDGTNSIVYTINDSDFINTNLYTSVSSTNSLESWVEVFNNKLTGITASVVGDQIKLTSNLGASDRAKLTINPSSTLVVKGMFSNILGLFADGKASDFTLDRNTAQFKLTTPLSIKDQLSAGSYNTQASIQSSQISSSSLTFSSDAYFWLLLDSIGTLISTGAINGTTLDVSKPSPNTIRYTSNISNAFSNVQVGDYIIAWSPELPLTDRLEGRVHAISSNYLDIVVTASEYAAATTVSSPYTLLENGFTVLRSQYVPKKFKIKAGTKTLFDIALELQTQSKSLNFSVYLQKYLKISSLTLDSVGSILVVAADSQAAFLQLPVGEYTESEGSLLAYLDSANYAGKMPSFVNSVFSDASASPIDSFVNSISSSVNLSGRDPNELIGILNPYGSINDAQAYNEFVQEKNISGATVQINNNPCITRVRSTDRFFLANPLDFGHSDQLTAILDGDVENKSFQIPIYRKTLTNTSYVSNPNNFNAYDVESGPTAEFYTAFKSNFDFSNFKVLMQAKKVLKPTPTQTAILYRSNQWGRSGEKIRISYNYPSSPNQSITSLVNVSDTVDITIYLQSGNSSTTSINSLTQWNVTITSNNPVAGVDQVTYTWNGTGANPNLSLTPGEYVNITTQSGFNKANTGIFRLSSQLGFAPTPTSFTVQRPTGAAVAENNIPTSAIGAITFYNSSSTTASSIVTYVNSNLSDFITASLVNDGGTSGSGIINLSTYEDSNFTIQNIQLLDGINWILSSNLYNNTIIATGNSTIGSNVLTEVFDTTDLRIGAPVYGPAGVLSSGTTITAINGYNVTISSNALLSSSNSSLTFINTGSPQFIFKKPLSLPTDVGYAFNDGESIVLVPTTADQVRRLISVFSVSGFLSDGKANLSNRENCLELSTNILGSSGSLQVAGGLASGYSLPVMDSAVLINNNYIQVSVEYASSLGIHSDQWFKLQASLPQKKLANLFSNTNVQIIPNSPSAGYSKIVLTNRNLTQRYFGKAKNISLNGLTFRVEKQGSLVCVTWTGSDPAGLTTSHLSTPVSFGASGGGNFSITPITNTSDATVHISTGLATFSGLSIGDYITIAGTPNSANNGTFLVTGISDTLSTPSDAGKTIQITNASAVSSTQVYSGATFTANVKVTEGDSVIFGAPFSLLNRGTFRVIRTFTDSFWIENPNVIEEEVTLNASSLTFYEYESTVPGDNFVITGSILNSANAGSYIVTQVLNAGGGHYSDTVVVSSVLTAKAPTSLNGYETAVYVQEGIPYSGYKKVYLISAQPSAPTRNSIIFDTINQYEKINNAANIEMVSLNKLNFNSTVQIGSDSYKYNTGLIAEANRIVYGDPRDSITYPGVGAAGSDIFIREPLTLRVKISVDVRLATGIPFTAIAQQVRSNISSLVNSNPVGKSIDISSIIGSVRIIPGIISVAIDSPLYNSSNDLIQVSPSEKTRIIDIINDISVSQLGT